MQTRQKSLTKIFIFGLLIVALPVVLFYFAHGKADEICALTCANADSSVVAATDSSADVRKPVTAVPVEVSSVTRGDVHDYILQNATLDTEDGVDVHARVTGLVKKLNVEEGDKVAQGTILCSLEDDDYRLARDKARVSYDKHRSDFRRLEDMHEKQLISTKEFEEARFGLEQARIDWETAELNLKRTRITAPIAGVITNRHVRLGEMVSTTSPLFKIVNVTDKIVVVHIPERDICRVKQGQHAFLSTENARVKRFEAEIKRLSPAVDASNGTLKVTIGVNDPDDELRPGMFVSVNIVTETHQNALLIPKAAVVYNNGTPYAFFIEQDTLSRRVRLETGFSDEQYVEVLSSIIETDRVIVVGQNGLKDGVRIKVVTGLLEEDREIAGRESAQQDKI
jgi:membrane fusion protein, multidrug efflux system